LQLAVPTIQLLHRFHIQGVHRAISCLLPPHLWVHVHCVQLQEHHQQLGIHALVQVIIIQQLLQEQLLQIVMLLGVHN